MNEGSTVNSVAFSPDGKILAIGDAKGLITLWEISGRHRIAAMNEGSTVKSAAFSPDGRTWRQEIRQATLTSAGRHSTAHHHIGRRQSRRCSVI